MLQLGSKLINPPQRGFQQRFVPMMLEIRFVLLIAPDNWDLADLRVVIACLNPSFLLGSQGGAVCSGNLPKKFLVEPVQLAISFGKRGVIVKRIVSRGARN